MSNTIQIVGNLDDFINLCVDEAVDSMELTLRTLTDQQGNPIMTACRDPPPTVSMTLVMDYVGLREDAPLFRHRQKLVKAYYALNEKNKKNVVGALMNPFRIAMAAVDKVKPFYLAWHEKVQHKAIPQRYSLHYYNQIFPEPKRLEHAPYSFEILPPLTHYMVKNSS